MHQGHVGIFRFALGAYLKQYVDLFLSEPMRPLLLDASEAEAAARLHFAALNSEVYLGAAGIAEHHLELGAENDVHRIRIHIRARADTRRSGDQLALEHLLDGFETGR